MLVSFIKQISSVGIYLLLWIVLSFLLLFLYYDLKAPFLPQFLATLVVTILTALPAFYSIKVLVPRLLYEKKIRKFIGSMILIAIGNSFVTFLIAGGFYSILRGKPVFATIQYIVIIIPFLFVINFLVVGASSAARIISDRFGMEEHLHVVENEKISNELAFLRAQINPHFLFNVLNTIYFQINKENKEARSSVEKLSEMLRYQLYECTSDLIDISKEIAYIENYFAVQQLRMEPGTDLQLKLPDAIEPFRIAPLLIMPLVENGFKHISHFKDASQNKLYISIYVEPDSLFVVSVLNTYMLADISDQSRASGGVGLKNIERRLELLYPGKHVLLKKRTENTYETTLKIKYHD